MIMPALFLMREGCITYGDLDIMTVDELRFWTSQYLRFRKDIEDGS